MDSLPCVSCIMPTCDRQAFVPRAIAYFLRQDYPNKELLIVDDGTDSIAGLIPNDPRIQLIRLNQRNSVGAKRNLACEKSNGSLIAHWDDDDWHAPHRLSYQVGELLRAGASICGIGDLLFLDTRDGKAWKYCYPPAQKPWLSGSSLLYTREFWSTHRFANISVGEDGQFVWSATPKQLLRLSDPTFHVGTIHGKNVSPKQTSAAWWKDHPQVELRKLLGDDWGLHCTICPESVSDPEPRCDSVNGEVLPMADIAVIVTCHQPYVDLLPQILASVNRQAPAAGERVLALDGCQALPAVYDGWKMVQGDWRHPSGGRNAGAAATQSPWLTFWDADNIMPEGYLAAAQAAIKTAASDVAILYPDVQLCDDRMNPTQKWTMPEWSYWTLRAENCVDTSSLWRREAIEIAGGWSFRAAGSFEDYALALDITAGGWKAAKLTGPAILMRSHRDGRMQRRWADGGALTDLWSARSLAIVTLLAGRDDVLDRWGRFLATAELPAKTSLYVVDNSGRPEFSRRAFEICSEINSSRSLTHLDFASSGPPYRPTDKEPYFVKGRHLHVARLYAGVLPRVTEDLVLTLEDDVEPPADAIRRLGVEIGFPSIANVAAVAATYPMPQYPQYACAGRGTDEWGGAVALNQLTGETIDIGCVGGGCTVWANWALKKVPVNFWWDQGLGWDAALSIQLRRAGYRIKLHGGVRCHHHLHGRVSQNASAMMAASKSVVVPSALKEPIIPCEKNAGSWIEPDRLGTYFPPYATTFAGDGKFRSHQEFLTTVPLDDQGLIRSDIPGWLRRDDALKLFEMAYFSHGGVIEIGSHQGLSTSIIATAVRDSGRQAAVVSIDKNPAYVANAKKNLERKGLGQLVNLLAADATQHLKAQINSGGQFGFIFIDHSHEYADVVGVCRTLDRLLLPGGFCLFHDFNDSRNHSKQHPEYGVSQAVCDILQPPAFEFHGIFGCTALYRRMG